MKPRIILVAALFSVSLTLLIAQTNSPFEHRDYWPEIWRGEEPYPYWADVPPDTGVWGEINIGSNEPSSGYPATSSIVVGVSDTFKIYIELTNEDTVSRDVSGYDISTWFEPVVFSLDADVREDKPLTTSSSFNWLFRCWMDFYHYQAITAPTSLASSWDLSNFDHYILVYDLWGLTQGRFRVMMRKTSSAPSWFQLPISFVKPVWITKPTSARDTINAYVECIWRAFHRSDLTSVNYFLNQIFDHDSTSIPGWAMKAKLEASTSDSAGYVAALDTTIAILERYGDPLLPDSTDMDTWTKYWYQDMLNIHKTLRWEFINNEYPYYE